MFKNIIKQNVFFIRGSRDLFKKDNGNTTSTKNIIFPYRFGGIDNNLSSQAAVEVMANQNRQEFLKLYINLLDSITKKDSQWLHKNVHPSLITPLLSRQDIKQINKQQKPTISFNNLSFGIGIKFQRQDYQYQTLAQQHSVRFYSHKDLFTPKNMMKPQLGLPILISFYLSVKSQRKLIVNDKPQDKQQEIHLLTIQKQPEVEMQTVMQVAMAKNDTINAFKKMILGSKEPWKIGNIDDFLKKRL